MRRGCARLAENASKHAELVVKKFAKLERSLRTAIEDREIWVSEQNPFECVSVFRFLDTYCTYSTRCQEKAEIRFVIPVDRLTSTRTYDLRSRPTSVWRENIYLRVVGGSRPSSEVRVQLCAEAPHSLQNTVVEKLDIRTDENNVEERSIGGITEDDYAAFSNWEATKMVELEDGSGDRGFGGFLTVYRYSSRIAVISMF